MSTQSEYALEAALINQLNGMEYASVVIDNEATIQLIALDKASQTTDATIAAFCKELGIEPPFAVQGQQA